MTNFELAMLKIAEQMVQDKDWDLQSVICNFDNNCITCPIAQYCTKHSDADIEEWLRQPTIHSQKTMKYLKKMDEIYKFVTEFNNRPNQTIGYIDFHDKIIEILGRDDSDDDG